MRRVRSKDSKIEVRLRKALWHKGYRYRKNYKALPGKPDIAITKHKIAIFCDSEFFHGKDWEKSLHVQIMRGSNAEFWEKKITRNQCRDKQDLVALAALGWHCITIWECQLKPQTRLSTLTSLEYTLNAIYLRDHSVAYPTLEEESTLERAAEQETKGYPEQNK